MDNTMIWFSISQLKIKTAQYVLSQMGIESHTVNKMDSAHAGLFGDIELHVDKQHEEKARKILIEEGILEE
jgi:hypothetical protein